MDESSKLKIAIVGQGYVGLPLTMLCLEKGHFVVGLDTDPRRVEYLKSGKSPVEGIEDLTISKHLQANQYLPSSDYRDAESFDIAIITVPTPLTDQLPDLTHIKAAGESIAPFITKNSAVILESTTYPGTTEELLLPILETGSRLMAGAEFFIGYSPERIDPGNAEWTVRNTPKVVSGIDGKSLGVVANFYQELGIPTVKVRGTREAEMTKLLENTFRHVNIALVNELARFSNSLEVNIWEAIEAASTKPFGFMKFTPGPGVGGHCLPVDPSYLAWAINEKSGSEFEFVSLANKVNSSMPEFVVFRAQQELERKGKSLKEGVIGVLGLAYKSKTGDIRESPAIRVSNLLQKHGARIVAVDPFVPDYLWPTDIKKFDPSVDDELSLSILLTDHPEQSFAQAISRSAILLDTRNVLKGINVFQL